MRVTRPSCAGIGAFEVAQMARLAQPKISHHDANATVNTSHAMAAAYCHVSRAASRRVHLVVRQQPAPTPR